MVTHGMSYTKLYDIWRGMKERCLNQNHHAYPNYGGRGISICKEFMSFEGFFKIMGTGHREGLTLERIDNNEGYYSSNLKWATRKVQARNRRGNKIIEYRGVKKCLAEWADYLSIDRKTLGTRLRKGLSVKEAFETPVKTRVKK